LVRSHINLLFFNIDFCKLLSHKSLCFLVNGTRLRFLIRDFLFLCDFEISSFASAYIWSEKTLTLCRMKVMTDHRLSFLVGCLNWLIFFAGSTVIYESATEVDVAPRILSRPKRYLIFPQGSNFQVNIFKLMLEKGCVYYLSPSSNSRNFFQ